MHVVSLWWLTFLLVGLAVGPAQAVNYTFPGSLPAGCSGSGPNYACANLTLGNNDTITIASPRPATITVNGNMSTDTSAINAGGVVDDLNLVVTGTLTTSHKAIINANVTAGTVSSAGTQVEFGGSVNATNGNLSLASKTTVGGSLISGSGAITVGNQSVISGSVSSTSGPILVEFKATVAGDISSSGAVTLENEVVASSCVRSTGSAAITLNWHSAAAGVCCGSGCSNTCVSNASGYAMPATCAPVTPPVTCIADNFSSGLNSALWNVSGSGYTPQVVSPPTVPSSRLRLTDNSSNRATMAQLKKWFPAANNKVVIEFDYFDYGGSGADGISVVLSDASVPPTPGGYGGSLGYANRSGVNGFNGGWLGVGLDEFGNYPNTTEGRRGYPAGYTAPAGANAAAGFYKHSIAVRGSGVAQSSGYALLANSGVVAPVLTTTNAAPHRYRVTMDHSNSINALVSVQRNTGSGFVTVVPPFDVRGANTGQAVVPSNMLLSFTGSTGGSTNFHEIGNVSVCATSMTDPGGSADAANFECIETGALATWSASARHPLYTKLADANFKFDIVALKSDGSIENGYVAAGGNAKNVTVALFDDSASPSPVCSAYASPVATQTVTYSSGDGGRKTIASNINLNRAWGKLRCRVTDANVTPTVFGCSTDTFSVRPQSFNVVTSSANGDNAGTNSSVATVVKAGANFSLTAGTGKVGYGGLPKINAALAEWPSVPSGGRAAPGVGILSGSFTGAASSASGNGATGVFTYAEVGYFRLQAQGVYDDTFAVQSSDTSNGDCSNDFSNALVGGKYGCKFGNTAATNHFGRFIPDHFRILAPVFAPACAVGGFSYMDQPISLSADIEAQNLGGTRTQNYSGSFAKGVVSVQIENASSGVPITSARLNATGSPAWAGGSYSYSADRFLRAATGPDGPYDALDIGLSVIDEAALPAASRPYLIVRNMDASSAACTTDLSGLSTAAGVCTATNIVSATRVRYGRLWLGNAYGSERLNLSLPYETQFWNGFAFVRNTLDTCTALNSANFGIGNYQGAVSAANLPVASIMAGTFATGAGSIILTAPDVAGSADIVVRLNPTLGMCPAWAPAYPAGVPTSADFLRGKWCGASYDRDPVARATFGLSRSGRQIYLREGY